MTPDALIAEMQRVLWATLEEREAAALGQRLERRLESGAAWEEEDRRLAARLSDAIERAYPEGSERERLARSLELAILEERVGDAGVLCVRGEPPRGWKAWRETAVVFDDPWDGTARFEHRVGYVAVRRGWGVPDIVLERYLFGGSALSALLVPETGRFFVAAGELLTIFDLGVRRLAIERELMLAGPIQRHGDRVLVHDECDLIAFALDGTEVWSVFADPPYAVSFESGVVVLQEELLRSTRRHRLSDGGLI